MCSGICSVGRLCQHQWLTHSSYTDNSIIIIVIIFVSTHVHAHTDTKVATEMIVKCLVGKVSGDTGYKTWSKDAKHRREAKMLGIFRDIWTENNGPLPWRLTTDERNELEQRMHRIVWPHYVERLCYKGYSFWTKPNRMWKARRKYRLLYFMLVTQLRDKVPAVRHALSLFVWAMRRLEGQVRTRIIYRGRI